MKFSKSVQSNFIFGAFADDHRELENELVPEWRAKYLDYNVRTIRLFFGGNIPNKSASSKAKRRLTLSRAHCVMSTPALLQLDSAGEPVMLACYHETLP